MSSKATELTFQNDMIRQLVANGWTLGKAENYNRKLALYEEDVLGFVKDTQDAQWQKFAKLYPNNPEKKFLERVASQLNKADPNAANKEMRTFGTLGVLRHELRDRGTRFSLCQFKPEHDLNPDTLARYEKNRLRVVPELVYSPWASPSAESTPSPPALSPALSPVLSPEERGRKNCQGMAYRSGAICERPAGGDVGVEVGVQAIGRERHQAVQDHALCHRPCH